MQRSCCLVCGLQPQLANPKLAAMTIAISEGGTHFNELTLLVSEIKSSGPRLAITSHHWLGSLLLWVCVTDKLSSKMAAEERVVLLRCLLGGRPHSRCRAISLSCMWQVDRCTGDKQMMRNKLATLNTRLLANILRTEVMGGQLVPSVPSQSMTQTSGPECNVRVQHEPGARRHSQSAYIRVLHPFVHAYFCIKEAAKVEPVFPV